MDFDLGSNLSGIVATFESRSWGSTIFNHAPAGNVVHLELTINFAAVTSHLLTNETNLTRSFFDIKVGRKYNSTVGQRLHSDSHVCYSIPLEAMSSWSCQEVTTR